MRSRSPATVLLILVVATLVPATAAAEAVFEIDFVDDPGEGFFDDTAQLPTQANPGTTLGEKRRIAFQRAAETWGELLDSPVPIRVAASMDSLFCGEDEVTLGAAGATAVFRDFPGAVRPATWHASALADSLAGTDLGEGDPDIQAVFNSELDLESCLPGVSWWYGDPSDAPANAFPFGTSVRHELAHGLGFATYVDRDTGEKFLGRDDTYLVHLEDHSLGADWSLLSAAERVASTVDTGDLHWTGPNVVAASSVLAAGRHPSGHVRMYAPDPAEVGSSVTHFDTVTSPNELMEPFLTFDSANLLTTELLRDLGWRAATGVLPPCSPGPGTLCIDDEPGDRRFQVQVTFNSVLGGGVAGDGEALSLAPLGVTRGGLFSFFNPANPELLVKVLDGCPVNHHRWVFYSAGTTVGFDLLVTDTRTGDTYLRSNPDETPAPPITDTLAFPCDGG